MKRTLFTIVLTCLFAFSAFAQAPAPKPGPAPAPEPEPEKKPEPAPADEEAIDDTEDVIFERLIGLYFEGRGGVFFTVGGTRGYSNGQPFFGFELGYDINERFSIQFGYASGYQAANPLMCPDANTCPSNDPADVCTGSDCYDYHLDFGLTFFNLSADYDLFHGRRWAFEGRLGGGAVIIDPSAEPDQAAVDFDVFGGIRFEYYTLLKHFTLAAEFDFFYVIQTGIPSMAVTASIIYNF
jgi:hypothetical protein